MMPDLLNRTYSIVEPFEADGRPKILLLPKGSAQPRVYTPATIEDGFHELEDDFKRYTGLKDSVVKQARNIMNNSVWDLPGDIENNLRRDGSVYDWSQFQEMFSEVGEELKACFNAHVYTFNPNDVAAFVGFIFNSYFCDIPQYAPRLMIVGASQTGKSRLEKLLKKLAYRGFKVSNTTFASIVNVISKQHITPILDEFADYSSDVRSALLQAYKTGDDTDGMITRFDKNTMDNVYYPIFGPMAISSKEDNFPEDVVNRSFQITMVENIGQKDIRKDIDTDWLKRIRTQLYRLRIVYHMMKGPGMEKYRKIFDLDEWFEGAKSFLEPDGKGYIQQSYEIPQRVPEFRNRTYSIAYAYFPIARLTGLVWETINKIEEIQDCSRDIIRNTDAGKVFNVMVRMSGINTARYQEDVINEMCSIPTKDVYNTIVCGECDDLIDGSLVQKLNTQRVGKLLNSLGFGTEYLHRTGHMTYIVKRESNRPVLASCVRKFCPEEVWERFNSLPFSKEEEAMQ